MVCRGVGAAARASLAEAACARDLCRGTIRAVTIADIGSIERRLRERRAGLHARLADLKRAPERGSGISFGKRVGDGTTEAVSRLNAVGVADSLNASLERIERALTKIAEGTYGMCDACGGEIPVPRLEAQPESAVCLTCARLVRRPS